MRRTPLTGRAQFRRLDVRDRAERIAHLARLGREAGRARFSAERLPGGLPEPTLALGCWIDGRLRGVAELYKLPGHPSRAELAASVEPPFQGRGLGTMLLERLIVLAHNRGIRSLLALCAEDNGRLIGLLRRFGARVVVADGEARAILDLLPATPATLALERFEQWHTIALRTVELQRLWLRRVAEPRAAVGAGIGALTPWR